METIRQSKFRRIIALILAIVFTQGFYSCKKSDDIGLSEEKLAAIDGEEIFKGIFFLEGSLPNEVKFLKSKLAVANDINLSNEVRIQKQKIVDEIISNINSVSPNYFKELEKAFKSENYYDLNEDIKKGSELIYVGLLQSETMKQLAPEVKTLLSKIDINSYDLKKPEEVKRFMEDINDVPGVESKEAALAAVVAVVAVVVVVTVAVAVSWVGAVQVGGFFLAWVETVGPESSSKKNPLSDFDSELLTRDLISAVASQR